MAESNAGTPAKVPDAAAALMGTTAASQAAVPAFFGAHRVFMAAPPGEPSPGRVFAGLKTSAVLFDQYGIAGHESGH